MSAELRAKLEDAAAASGRSVNADIVWRLEKSFEPQLAIPDELKIRLTGAAVMARRSLEAEVVQRLALSLESLESITFDNRIQELKLVKREIEAEEENIRQLVQLNSPEDAIEHAKTALAALERRRVRINEDLTELFLRFDGPKSFLADLELDIETFETLSKIK